MRKGKVRLRGMNEILENIVIQPKAGFIVTAHVLLKMILASKRASALWNNAGIRFLASVAAKVSLAMLLSLELPAASRLWAFKDLI